MHRKWTDTEPAQHVRGCTYCSTLKCNVQASAGFIEIKETLSLPPSLGWLEIFPELCRNMRQTRARR